MSIRALHPQRDRALAVRLLDLQHRAYAVEAALIGDARIPPLQEGVDDLQRQPLQWIGVLGADESIAGAAGFEEDAGHLSIDRLVVDPSRLRQGIGRRLVGWLQQRAGPRTVTVSTGRANHPARTLYEQAGFERVQDAEAVPGLWVTHYRWRA